MIEQIKQEKVSTCVEVGKMNRYTIQLKERKDERLYRLPGSFMVCSKTYQNIQSSHPTKTSNICGHIWHCDVPHLPSFYKSADYCPPHYYLDIWLRSYGISSHIQQHHIYGRKRQRPDTYSLRDKQGRH